MKERYEKLRGERRLGRVPVDIGVMAEHLITPKIGIKVTGLPIDALFITAFYTPQSDALHFVYAHESFEQAEEGVEIPRLDVYYEKYEVKENHE